MTRSTVRTRVVGRKADLLLAQAADAGLTPSQYVGRLVVEADRRRRPPPPPRPTPTTTRSPR